MSTPETPNDREGALSRRRFLQTSATAASGLVLGLHLPLERGRGAALAGETDAASDLAPNAFVRIGPDDVVTVTIKHIEFGQGPMTGLATPVAEELDVEWSQVRAELAPADDTRFAHTWAPMQMTGGSTAMANSYDQMRRAGATARAMLLQAAAARWGVPVESLETVPGRVREKQGKRSARYGELVAAAAKLSPPDPASVALKDPKDFRLIGTDLPRLDTPGKVDGSAVYTIDVKRPGMLTVVIARPPRFGARVVKVDDTKARAVPGVVDVKTLDEGVAVYAKGFWPAKKGRDRLEIEWDESGTERRDSAAVIDAYRALAKRPGARAEGARGDADAAFEGAAQVIEAEYVFPYLAHAPMEPLDAVIEKDGADYRIWMGSQGATRDREAFAEEFGVPLERIHIDIQLAGGSFGRRSTHRAEFARETAHAFQAIGERTPLKVMWSREDDIQGGFYRPIYVHRLKGAIDADGQPLAWRQVIVGQSVRSGGRKAPDDPVDRTTVEGVSNLAYAVPNLDVSVHSPHFEVPVLWWRSVGHTHTGYTAETFVDELLAAGGRDPVAGRLALLADHPRHRAALEAVAAAADWGRKAPEGRAYGVAVHESFKSVVAQIAEVGADANGRPKVHRIWCAVDCGVAVNPDIVKAQMEGGIGYGLGAALTGEITLARGRVVQSNFHDYHPIRIDDMPRVDVTIVPSTASPTGVGEPGVPPAAPAVANAWAALTGERLRRLPFRAPAA